MVFNMVLKDPCFTWVIVKETEVWTFLISLLRRDNIWENSFR